MKKIVLLASLVGCVIVNVSVTPAWAQFSVLLEPQKVTWQNLPAPTPSNGYVEPVPIYYYCFEPTVLLAPAFEDDTVHFKLAFDRKGDSLNSFPMTIPVGNGDLAVWIAYFPDSVSHRTQVVWTTAPANSPDTEVFWTDTLTGLVVTSGVAPAIQTDLSASVIPLEDGHSIEIVPAANVIAPLAFQLFNILGKNVFSGSISGTQIVSMGTLPRGVYFYRLTSGQMNQSGKIILGE